MGPPARFIYQHHTTTGSWVVVDRLLDRTIRLAADMLSAADIALDEELTWRRACERWQREEQREGPPPIF